MRWNSRIVHTVLLVLAFILAACNPVAEWTSVNQLKQQTWVLASLDGEAALPQVAITFEFSDDGRTVGGFAGCNRYGGLYELDGDALDVMDIYASTEDCPDQEIMAQEARYFDVLGAVTSYAVEDDTLTLTTDAGETLVFAAQE